MPSKSQAQLEQSADVPINTLEADMETLAKIGEAASLNDLVLGLSPAVAVASLYVSNANSLSILYENAVATQQQQTQLAQSALKAGIAQMDKVTESSSAAAASAENPDQDLLDLLKALKTAVQ
ncbi:RebB family R body protein [Labrenzia sp. R4_2]|uniref:RebB family R body protein n=1 Tax=Labrenzia sp. R4_2 TaxID=2821107 RepID=UPI001ADC6F4E|nr:RebB family R body protein [Labrenzia sp. R4_2]MBO9419979.1 RebB family R body protein [Labrenzia sp. R4_2]